MYVWLRLRRGGGGGYWVLRRVLVLGLDWKLIMMRPRVRDSLVLCFDGTGNKFKGNSGDTNILKIFRMLDRSGGDQCK